MTDYRIEALIDNVERVIVGKREVIELVVSAMLAGGHVLVEDVPGVGKTQMVSSLANSCGGDFGRIQLTPDIMPSDITGFTMIDPVTHNNEFRKGAAFCNFLLADELNRASPKSQSALLEIMEEGQVSMDGVTYPLPKPFMVIATQNPVETFGTYHLPEAQMDRFIMKVSIGYPSEADELDIINRNERRVSPKALGTAISTDDIIELMDKVPEINCSEKIKSYIIALVNESRHVDYITLPVSPRGSIAMYRMAKAYAMVKGREYVLPDDIKFLAPYVLSHRIILSSKGKSMVKTPEAAVRYMLEMVAVPV